MRALSKSDLAVEFGAAMCRGQRTHLDEIMSESWSNTCPYAGIYQVGVRAWWLDVANWVVFQWASLQ